jgi:hypothetical protein
MTNMNAPARVAGVAIGSHTHLCAFFNSREEEYSILLPFVKEGIERGESALHVVPSDTRSEHLRRLEQCGIRQASACLHGQLTVLDWADVRGHGDRVDPFAMLSLVESAMQARREAGFRKTRIVAHIEWPPGGRLDELVAFDHAFNQRIAPYDDDAVVCVYDAARFGAGVAMDVMRTHPLVIIGGVMHVNPFFVPPQDFLREVGERALRAGTA